MIIDILRQTPPWVFLLLVALIALGARRLRAGDVVPRQLLILPVAMTALSVFGLWQAFGASVVAGVAWAVVLLASLAIGRRLPPVDGVQYSPASRRVHVPGSAVPLVLMMAIFFLRYAVAVMLAMHPSLRIETPFVAGIGALYGLSCGCFAARALRTWKSAFGSERRVASTVAAAA